MSTLTERLDLSGRTALVTGATKGIGRAIAGELAALGARVVVVARDADAVARTADELDGEAVPADVADPDGRASVVAAVREAAAYGPLAVLVNNVGMNIRGTTLDYGDDDLRRVISVNTEAAFSLSRDLHPLLAAAAAETGDAVIINNSSIASRTIIPMSSCAYAMSKGAMDTMSDFMAVEFGPQGIRVNAVHPWYIRTPLAEPVLADAAKADRIIGSTPMGRVGEPEEVARVVAFLSSPAASYVSGAHVEIDGAFARSALR